MFVKDRQKSQNKFEVYSFIVKQLKLIARRWTWDFPTLNLEIYSIGRSLIIGREPNYYIKKMLKHGHLILDVANL